MDNKNFNHSRRRLLMGTGTLAAAGVVGGFVPRSVSAAKMQTIQAKQLIPVKGYAFNDYSLTLKPYQYQHRALLAKDVAIEIQYCGVCHSDIHAAHKDWGEQIMPQVPGHEITGIVIAVGSGVSKFKVGDRVGVGTMVDSCGHCAECRSDHEQYCENGITYTYGTPADKALHPTGITQGGYSNRIVVTEHFVCRIPDNLALQHAGPLMCAGITVYSPLRHWNVRQGQRIGVVGLGGLGHLAVKFAKALGAEVVVFTTSPDKVADAKRFGASDVVVNFDPKKLAQYKRQFDFILGTTPYQIELDGLMATLKRDATFCLVGVSPIDQPNQLLPFTTIFGRYSFAGSQTGGMRETQEVLDFCAEKGIKPEIELINIQDTAKAWRRMLAKQTRYRVVIDMQSLNG